MASRARRDCADTAWGPVYHGRDTVRRWAQKWFADGGVVHRWAVTDHFVAGDREVAQWTFECTWQGDRTAFDGATVARVADGRVVELREYQTTAPLYDWQGTWR
ncbi:nuclear transport factor 2 family protein [Streptomyces sp. 3MP-14]|uniref:Nuclear transport factor 2 family protein n=1 Tax=Streptomyces mimosae TaxID=2586635 RepID=A0A5N6A677_9ACTN|nr:MULTISPECIES: nuclear transport factor 2 family protein [Streptomyces]KAB8163449.1 nuclear transport factor 2 family protein [Streptomyces mimosae]KAB8174726.1 nuclear transport factor 2 family protein [Streptomyces sp. 3MP-14]